MKKFLPIILTSVLTVSMLTGCLNSETPATPAEPAAQSSTPAPEQQAADTLTSASPKESSNPEDLLKGLSESGYWIFAVLSDVTLDKELVVSGEFHDKDDASAKIYRKLALYAQDADRNVTESYTLTVPQITVKSPAFRIQNGVVKGNIAVDADGFELVGATVEGNVTFKTQAQMDSAKLTEGTVTGTVSVGDSATDAVTSASPKESSNPDDIIKGLSESGSWIFSILSDVTLDKELVVSGEFHDKEDASAKLYRKLALYAQDADRNVTANYILTVPQITVKSPAFRIQNGTVKGNISVDADGFELAGTTVEGNVTFKTQAQMDSAILETGTVTGTVSVE